MSRSPRGLHVSPMIHYDCKLHSCTVARCGTVGCGVVAGTLSCASVRIENLKPEKVREHAGRNRTPENSDGLHRVSKEFKWAEFFARRMRQQPVCLLGISSLCLGRLHETCILEACMVRDASHLLASKSMCLLVFLSLCPCVKHV